MYRLDDPPPLQHIRKYGCVAWFYDAKPGTANSLHALA